jgi:hypothetical protein
MFRYPPQTQRVCRWDCAIRAFPCVATMKPNRKHRSLRDRSQSKTCPRGHPDSAATMRRLRQDHSNSAGSTGRGRCVTSATAYRCQRIRRLARKNIDHNGRVKRVSHVNDTLQNEGVERQYWRHFHLIVMNLRVAISPPLLKMRSFGLKVVIASAPLC